MAETTLLSFGVGKVWDLLVRESDKFKGVKEQFDELKRDLDMLRCFLEDADAKKHTSAMVRNNVKEIKEIVYDAEDIIETFLLKKELGKKRGIWNTVTKFSNRMGLASDMKAISKRIARVNSNMQRLGVLKVIDKEWDTVPSLQERQRQMRKTFPTDNEDHLVGLEENVKRLIGHLVEEGSVQVVSITGMGGIGKTTLALQIFNHEMVKNHFDGVAWVCVSQQFERKNVWKAILQKLSSKHDENVSNMSEEMLQERLFQLLETSTSLIILDDIWKEGDWDMLKPAFPSKKAGWKVLLTSRNENVALHADPTCVILKPECLTLEESWTLFRSKAFPWKDSTIDVGYEEMGRQMIKHCGGLPLAVKVLGGLLFSKYTIDEWKRISENIKSHITKETSFNDRHIISINDILSLSFEELPVYLKQCFLYFAHFPEDYTISVKKLSCYWAGEGIPTPRYYHGLSIQNVADRYIEELVKRNMVISVRDKLTSRFKTCHLHDMMREVCLRKAEEENFVHIVDIADSKSPCKSRRMAIHIKRYNLEREMLNPKLRSVLVIDYVGSRLWFTRLLLIRVLDLSRAGFREGKLPSSIGKLIHLKYLSLFEAMVTHLPSSMRNLKQLLYLNLHVRENSTVLMPNFMKEMHKLTYLYLPTYLCLLWDIDHKEKLELGNLVNLEKLKNFSTENSNVKDLQRMTKLRSLSINIRGKECAMEALSSSISELRQLEDLSIYECHMNEEGFVLECIHLKKLKLGIYMPSLPDVQHFPSHLVTISLDKCLLKEDPMPILEKLVQLKEVTLRNQSFSGRLMFCSSGGFPQLHTLELFKLEEWEEWIVEEGSMPLLHNLTVQYCPKFKRFPAGGFPKLHTLKLFKLEEWEDWIVEEGFMPLLHNLTVQYCPKFKRFCVGGFPKLHTLELWKLNEWEEWIVEEGSMPLLHSLRIWNCDKLKKLPVGQRFIIPKLHTLELWGLNEWEEWIIEEGSMPLLQDLYIQDCPKLKQFSAGVFPKLHRLQLQGLDEWEEWIVEEGSMPLLHSLDIKACPKLKQFSAGVFPKLHRLQLWRLNEWEEWIVEEGSMPLLHSLCISVCPKLTELPDGLRFINSLKKLTMGNEWKQRLSEGGEDYQKFKHIPSIEFINEI